MTQKADMRAVMAEQDREDPRVTLGSIVYSDLGGLARRPVPLAAFLASFDALDFAQQQADSDGRRTLTVVDYDTRKTTVVRAKP